MKNWKEILIEPETSIKRAIEVIDNSALQIAIVVNQDKCLLGTVTDGDIRRGILKGISLEETVDKVMNTSPTVVRENEKDKILFVMRSKKLRHVPVVNSENRIIGLEILEELLQQDKRNNLVVLMAGGLGSRLRPLTNDCPKPLLKIGSKPILQTILESFVDSGFSKFYISVNYKAEMIEEYFGTGFKWGVDIKYLHETQSMGTAGALGLLPEKPKDPIIVMNGDLITNVNFQRLLEFHLENKAQATICVREYDFKVPYGVVKVDNNRLVGIDEKPVHKFFVSAGIYVLEPKILDLIPRDSFYDMPTLYERLIKLNYETIAFPIREYWLDIGHMDDFEKAKGDYKEVSDD